MRVRPALYSGSARVLAGLAGIAYGFVCYVYLTLPDVRGLAAANPSSTAFMRMRAAEAAAGGLKPRHLHRWVPYSRISPNLKRAVVVTEDSAFWNHEGIDVAEIRQAIADALTHRRWPRGASTITQQLAKNLYLSPSYDPLRKLRELILARRLEAALPKTRILELYLNVIEWGDRVWGAEAAARTYFAIPAASLSRQQSALLAGAIINPRLYNPARPGKRLTGRQRLILARMGDGGDTPPALATKPLDELSIDDGPQPTHVPATLGEDDPGENGGDLPFAPDEPDSDPSPPVELPPI